LEKKTASSAAAVAVSTFWSDVDSRDRYVCANNRSCSGHTSALRCSSSRASSHTAKAPATDVLALSSLEWHRSRCALAVRSVARLTSRSAFSQSFVVTSRASMPLHHRATASPNARTALAHAFCCCAFSRRPPPPRGSSTLPSSAILPPPISPRLWSSPATDGSSAVSPSSCEYTESPIPTFARRYDAIASIFPQLNSLTPPAPSSSRAAPARDARSFFDAMRRVPPSFLRGGGVTAEDGRRDPVSQREDAALLTAALLPQLLERS